MGIDLASAEPAAAARALSTAAADYPVICDEEAVAAAMEATAGEHGD